MAKVRKNSADHPAPTASISLNIAQWCAVAGVPEQTFFILPDECKPHSFRVGRRQHITETPREWQKRIADRGGIASDEMVRYSRSTSKAA